jgi:hypothetical protein
VLAAHPFNVDSIIKRGIGLRLTKSTIQVTGPCTGRGAGQGAEAESWAGWSIDHQCCCSVSQRAEAQPACLQELPPETACLPACMHGGKKVTEAEQQVWVRPRSIGVAHTRSIAHAPPSAALPLAPPPKGVHLVAFDMAVRAHEPRQPQEEEAPFQTNENPLEVRRQGWCPLMSLCTTSDPCLVAV